LMSDAKLSFPRWPAAWFGRECTQNEQNQIARAFADSGVIGAPSGLGVLMGAPVTMTFGTEEQKQRWLPNLANGTEGWCQLFSEPGAGSDLASVSCRAERDGDEWVINGQKVWTSGALHSTRGMLVARNDFDQPKHKGLTYFIIDLEQPGVEIRPIKQMNGAAHFNEVFFNDARVNDGQLLQQHWALSAVVFPKVQVVASVYLQGSKLGFSIAPWAICLNMSRQRSLTQMNTAVFPPLFK
jgi:alkylation response protein AidB-like acyl-CoA dehydrogenase